MSHGGWFDVAHELEHLNGKSHHHAEDGSIHYDESGESDKHFAEHSASQQVPTPPSVVTPAIALALLSVVQSDLREYIPDPIPERPQRPPSTSG